MSAVRDLKGYETDTLRVIKRIGSLNNKSLWLVLCKKCNGKFKSVAGNITSGNTTQCRNCSNKQVGEKARDNLVGQRFTRLLVIEPAGSKNYKALWKCLCDCGEITFLTTNELNTENTKSCGCLNAEKVQERAEERRLKLEGHTYNNLQVNSYAYSRGNRSYFNCTCLICGKDCVKVGKYIVDEETTSCSRECTQTHDWTGYENSFLRVVKKSDRRGNSGEVMWDCHCLLCNNPFTTYAHSLAMKMGCKCRQKLKAALLGRANNDWFQMKSQMYWADERNRQDQAEKLRQNWKNQFSQGES